MAKRKTAPKKRDKKGGVMYGGQSTLVPASYLPEGIVQRQDGTLVWTYTQKALLYLG